MTVFSFHISVCLQKLRGFAKGRVHGVSSTLKVDHPLESVIRSRWHLVSMLGMIRASGDTRSIVVPRENCTSFPFRFMPLCLEFRIFKAYKHLLVGKKTVCEKFADGSPPVSPKLWEVSRDFAAFKTEGAKSAGHIAGAP